MPESGKGDGPSCQKVLPTFQEVARHFTPAWFAVTMGTGAVSILFHSFPYNNDSYAMKLFSLVFFFFALALFVLFTVLSAARYILFPDIWSRMLQHPAQSLFLGTFPMGAFTLFTASITVVYGTYHFGGRLFVYVIWALWWLTIGVAILCCCGIVHIMITRQEHCLESMSLAWLLPIMTLVVGASTGGVIAQALAQYTPAGALATLTFSACMVAIGLPLIMMVLTVYLLRIIIYGYSKGPAILSIFLPVGPAGQSACAVLLIGGGLKSLLPQSHEGLLAAPGAGETINVICIMAAFVLWSFETMWVISAFLGLWHSLRRTQVPFRLTFWSMIFPNGVYANCTLTLAVTLSSRFFRVWGAIYAVATLLLWVYIAVQTLRLCSGGRIFDALPMEAEIGGSGLNTTLVEGKTQHPVTGV